jgi:hypothetical protein
MTLQTGHGGCHEAVGRRADVCSAALAGALKLALQGTAEPLCDRLLARACNLLDEVDEILLRLDPRQDHATFARVATLHRELESIQALSRNVSRAVGRHPPTIQALRANRRLA